MIDFQRLCEDRRLVHFVGPGHRHVRSGWIGVPCFQCGGDEFQLGFSTVRGNFICWRCGSIGCHAVLKGLLRIDDDNEIKRIIAEYSIPGTRDAPAEEISRKTRLDYPPDTGELRAPLRRYLERRRFDPDKLVSDWSLRGVGPRGGPDWGWRILIPICNDSGREVSYTGRAIADGVEPRYFMLPNADALESPDSFLFGIVKAIYDTVLIVEGPTGVFRLGPGAVATLSFHWHPAQANRLRKFKRRIILVDPSPAAALTSAERLARNLALFPGETEIRCNFESQPGEYKRKIVDRIRAEAGLPKIQ